MVVVLALAVLLAGAVVVGLVAGSGTFIHLDLRWPRVACAGFAGAALAVAGCLMQGLFRNPLASPSVLGTSSGAALGGQLTLLLHGSVAAALPIWCVPEMVLPLGCLAGAGLALALVMLVGGRVLAGGGDALVALLLTGFLLTSVLAACSSLVTWLSQEQWELGRALVAFTLGGVDGAGVRQVAMATPLVVAGVVAAWCWGRPLDLLLAGEEEAASLGVDVRRVRIWILVWTAVLSGVAVAIGGGVAFVGLVVPHALRPFTGVAHRRLIPAAAVGGAAFLILCDAACRLLPGGALPLGVVTALVGAPVFLALLLRWRTG